MMEEVADRAEEQQLRSMAKEFLRTLSKEDEQTVRAGLGEGKTQLEFERMVGKVLEMKNTAVSRGDRGMEIGRQIEEILIHGFPRVFSSNEVMEWLKDIDPEVEEQCHELSGNMRQVPSPPAPDGQVMRFAAMKILGLKITRGLKEYVDGGKVPERTEGLHFEQVLSPSQRINLLRSKQTGDLLKAFRSMGLNVFQAATVIREQLRLCLAGTDLSDAIQAVRINDTRRVEHLDERGRRSTRLATVPYPQGDISIYMFSEAAAQSWRQLRRPPALSVLGIPVDLVASSGRAAIRDEFENLVMGSDLAATAIARGVQSAQGVVKLTAQVSISIGDQHKSSVLGLVRKKAEQLLLDALGGTETGILAVTLPQSSQDAPVFNGQMCVHVVEVLDAMGVYVSEVKKCLQGESNSLLRLRSGGRVHNIRIRGQIKEERLQLDHGIRPTPPQAKTQDQFDYDLGKRLLHIGPLWMAAATDDGSPLVTVNDPSKGIVMTPFSEWPNNRKVMPNGARHVLDVFDPIQYGLTEETFYNTITAGEGRTVAIYNDIVEEQEVLYLFHPIRDPFNVRQNAGNSEISISAAQGARSAAATSSAPIATSTFIADSQQFERNRSIQLSLRQELLREQGSLTKKFSELRGLIPEMTIDPDWVAWGEDLQTLFREFADKVEPSLQQILTSQPAPPTTPELLEQTQRELMNLQLEHGSLMHRIELLAQRKPSPLLSLAPAVSRASTSGPSTPEEAVQQAKHRRNAEKNRRDPGKSGGSM